MQGKISVVDSSHKHWICQRHTKIEAILSIRLKSKWPALCSNLGLHKVYQTTLPLHQYMDMDKLASHKTLTNPTISISHQAQEI